MSNEPVIVDVADCEWETWAEAEIATRGAMSWKTLLSSEKTPSAGMTLGVADRAQAIIKATVTRPPKSILFWPAGESSKSTGNPVPSG